MGPARLGESYAEQTSGRTQPYWFDEVRPFLRRRLDADLGVDVAVVGAGLAGILSAYRLALQGKRVAILEDRAIGSGESGRTTAHFTNCLDDRYESIESAHGEEGARKAAQSHTLAIEEIERIVGEEKIRCDLERVDGHLFLHPTDKPESLDKEYSACRRAGLGVERLEETPFLTQAGPCLRFPDQVQLHPLKLIAGLVSRIEREGGLVYTQSRVDNVDGTDLTCNGYTVKAGHVLACTNVPFHNKIAMHTKQAAYRTYVVAGRLAGKVPHALWWDTGDQKSKSVAPPYHFVRIHSGPQGDTLIVGGEDHKTGHPQRGDPFERLEAWARSKFPLGEVTHAWSGQVVEPFDHLAFLGEDPTEKRRGIATGDSGNGMTHAVLASLVLSARATRGEPPAWASIYDPSRKLTSGIPAFLKETVGDVVANYADYVRPDSDRPARLRPGEGMVQRGLHPRAIYKDAQGVLRECSAICPHLGCLVRWNKVEGSFDCPCHGSRFAPDGRKLNGPADADLAATEERDREARAARSKPAREGETATSAVQGSGRPRDKRGGVAPGNPLTE